MKAQESTAEEETRARQEQTAISQSLTFLSKLLSEFASPEVQKAILHSFTKKMAREAPKGTDTMGDAAFVVHSAFPLDKEDQTQLLLALKAFKDGGSSQPTFSLDPSLVAGVEITAGATVLRANLRDELVFFSKAVSNGG